MADPNRPHTRLRQFRLPIRWTGCSWEPRRTIRFKDASGQYYELDVADVLRLGLFDLDTTTPLRRDALRAWAAPPAAEHAPAHVETV